jgi:hypothetical protein
MMANRQQSAMATGEIGDRRDATSALRPPGQPLRTAFNRSAGTA